jgi:hypothetical protein
MTSRVSIPWTRLAVEGIAIVASILLAFAIDAWWANRAASNEETEILTALKREFEINLVTLEEQLAYREAVRASANLILEAAAGKIRLEPAELDRLLGDIVWTGWVDLSTGALASLLQSGKLSLIKNMKLREQLAALPYWEGNTAKLEESELLHLNADIYPFLTEHAYLPQIHNTMKGQPGVGDYMYPTAQPTGEARDHTYLLQNPKFVGMISLELLDHHDAIWGYGTLSEKFEAAIGMIESELAGRQ